MPASAVRPAQEHVARLAKRLAIAPQGGQQVWQHHRHRRVRSSPTGAIWCRRRNPWESCRGLFSKSGNEHSKSSRGLMQRLPPWEAGNPSGRGCVAQFQQLAARRLASRKRHAGQRKSRMTLILMSSNMSSEWPRAVVVTHRARKECIEGELHGVLSRQDLTGPTIERSSI
jgi:hypothetical protein